MMGIKVSIFSRLRRSLGCSQYLTPKNPIKKIKGNGEKTLKN
jgi:hypothetical protein